MMTDPAVPRLINGHYHLDGLVLPRVTTILGIIAQPGLEAWKHRVGLEAAARTTETATALGTRVHAACEAVNRGDVWTADDELDPFVEAYCRWHRETVAEVISAERFVHHARHLYGGTLDLLARLQDGRRALIDIKTSKSPDGKWPLQLAAYAVALDELGEPVEARIVVNLPSSQPGVLRSYDYTDTARDDKAWLAALRLWRYWERHKLDWKTLK